MSIKRNQLDIIAEIISLCLLFFTTIYVIIMYFKLPEKIPMHYNALGVIDRYGSKEELFILVIIAWIMYIGLTLITKFPQLWNTGVTITLENKERVYRLIKNMLKILKLEIIIIFCYLIFVTTTLVNIPSYFILVSLVMMFTTMIVFGIMLIKNK